MLRHDVIVVVVIVIVIKLAVRQLVTHKQNKTT